MNNTNIAKKTIFDNYNHVPEILSRDALAIKIKTNLFTPDLLIVSLKNVIVWRSLESNGSLRLSYTLENFPVATYFYVILC